MLIECVKVQSYCTCATMFTNTAVAALLCLGAASLTHGKLDKYVTPCSFKDPKLDDCMVARANALLPKIVAGIREWNILSMNPLLLPESQLHQGGTGPVAFSFNLKNVQIYGFNVITVTSFKLDKKTFDMDIGLKYPVFKFLGDYEVKGRLLLLSLAGSGKANITFVDIFTQMAFKTAREKRGNETYLKITDASSITTVEKMILKLDNLFNNTQLSDQMNLVLNENSADVYNELRTSVDENISGLTVAIVSRMFSKLPLKELFTDIDV